MTLREVDRKEVYTKSRTQYRRLLNLQEMFLSSNIDAAEVDWKDEYATARRLYRSLSVSIKKHDYSDKIECMKLGDKVYLFRKEESGD